MSTDDALDPADFDLSAAGAPADAEPTPDEPTPDEPTPDEPTPDEPTPDEPTPDESADSEGPEAATPRKPSAAELLIPPECEHTLAILDREQLTELTIEAVREARAQPNHYWVGRLLSLRNGLMMRNERRLLALCLDALVDLELSHGEPTRAVEFAKTLWGVRELLGEPYKAHAAALRMAHAQEAVGQPEAAEVTLHKALALAQKLAPGGNLVPASAAASRTLTALGQLLVRQGRVDEGRGWLEGAVEIAEDDETRAEAQRALGG